MRTSVLPSILFFIIVPLFVNISNLDSTKSAFVLEQIVSLVGIILFTPIVYCELNQSIYEMVITKKIKFEYTFILRFMMLTIVAILELHLFCILMKLLGSNYPYWPFYFGSLVTLIFLGSIGVFTVSFF